MIYNSFVMIRFTTKKTQTLGWSKGIYFIKVAQDETILFEEKLTLQ